MPGQLFLPLSLQFWTIPLPMGRSSIQLSPSTEFFNQLCMPGQLFLLPSLQFWTIPLPVAALSSTQIQSSSTSSACQLSFFLEPAVLGHLAARVPWQHTAQPEHGVLQLILHARSLRSDSLEEWKQQRKSRLLVLKTQGGPSFSFDFNIKYGNENVRYVTVHNVQQEALEGLFIHSHIQELPLLF
jgi:hypothetical protein